MRSNLADKLPPAHSGDADSSTEVGRDSADRQFISIAQWWRRQGILSDRLRRVAAYACLIVIGHLAWEILQLPLYTIWTTGTLLDQAFAIVHCTTGDLLIGLSSLAVALVVLAARDWPVRGFVRVAVLAIAFGVAYTGFSEWLNVSVRRGWAYSELMPVISIGVARIGLSPIAQWIVVPGVAFWIIWRFGRRRPTS